MIIHSLSLNEGGGIIPQNDVSIPEDEASVIIGLGGTGCDTIKNLKKKIYTQLQPSNPGDAVPQYDMLRLLAIDTDDTGFDKQYSVSDVDPTNEFVSLKTPNLSAILDPYSATGRPALKNDPVYNTWMSIDQIHPLLAEAGAGGIRQMGRFMLMQHAQEVYQKIQSSIAGAITGMQVNGQVNIHIIAGISGGTGSGTFIDVCYLVRKVLHDNGWNGKVFGYFYLPDVVISKPSVSGDAIKTKLNRRNGYAAFRELDYLMDLTGENDWFTQNYPGYIKQVHTQERPVDLCHLISATNANGDIPKESYNYSVNVVTDYIMAYLAHAELKDAEAGNDGGLTMQGLLANIEEGIAELDKTSGAIMRYTILGASNAEVPFTQIATYLAQGYYKKISTISHNVPGDNDVTTFAGKIGLTYESINKKITARAGQGALGAILDNVDSKDCKSAVITEKNMHPAALLQPAEHWLAGFKGKVEENYKALSSPLESYGDPAVADNNSYIALVHKELLTICANADGKGGPGYAAKILSRAGKDLVNITDGLIKQNQEKYAFEQAQTNIETVVNNRRDDFLHAGFFAVKSRWNDYVNAMAQYQSHLAKLFTLERIDLLLHTFKRQLQELYTEFYQKLDKVCDNLEDTFADNASYLDNPDVVRKTNAYTWRIIELDNVRDDLDDVIRKIEPQTACNDLMNHMLKVENQKEWISEVDYRIGRLVNGFMLEKFHDQLDKTIQDYIRSMHPGKSDSAIIQDIKLDILGKTDVDAEPMFWKIPSYQLNSNSAFASSIMTVPKASTLITAAADQFRLENKHNYAVRETSIGDRVFALRFYSGIPLYAYQGVSLMHTAYQQDVDGGLAGLHLFEHNTALEQKKDKTAEDLQTIRETAWGTYLPYPTPFSIAHIKGEILTDTEAEDEKAFEAAKANGIIHKNTSNHWCIYANNEDVKAFCGNTKESFMKNGAFDYNAYEAKKAELANLKAGWSDEGKCTVVGLMVSTKVVPSFEPATLKDKFMRSPKLIDLTKACVANYGLIDEEIKNLEEIGEAITDGNANTQLFINALETGILNQGIGKITYASYDSFGMADEVNLSTEPADLSPVFIVYKAYCGYLKLSDNEKETIKTAAKAKIDNLQAGDDAIALKLRTTLKNSWNMIAAVTNSMPDTRKQEIRKFYKDLREGLEAYAMQFPSYAPVWSNN